MALRTGLSERPLVAALIEEDDMAHEKPGTKSEDQPKSDQISNDEVEPAIIEDEDKNIEEEGDPLGANFA
jgi:hypothetical protein